MNELRKARVGVLAALLGLNGCPAADPPADAFTASADAPNAPDQDAGAPDAGGDGDTGVPSMIDAGEPLDAPAAPTDIGPPDSYSAPEMCSAEGMFRRVACACGGMQSEQCMGGTWQIVVSCDGMMECTPGAFETRRGSYCVVDQRTCEDDCSWGAWLNVVPRGDCPTPGSAFCGGTIDCICQPDCSCIDNPDCMTMP
jgi:hypothetical protein